MTPMDTADTTMDLVVERWRAMTPRDKLDEVAALNESVEQLAAAGVRQRHPTADEEAVRLRVIALRLGRDLMVDVYGWDPVIKGW